MRGIWRRHTKDGSPARGELARCAPGETGARSVAIPRLAGNDSQTSPGKFPNHARPNRGGVAMSRLPVRVVLAAGLLVGLATRAAPQTACTSPLDPACNHLKCYQISDKPSTVVHVDKTPVVQIDNQFGREVLYRLQPVLLCVPSKKSCCCPGTSSCPAGATGCSAANCQPNPVNAPGLPHFKCYKVKAKTCPTPDCATAKPVNFPKGTAVNLRDQFGQE